MLLNATSVACGCEGRQCSRHSLIGRGALLQRAYASRFVAPWLKGTLKKANADYSSFVLDYFLIASPAVARSFGDIARDTASYPARWRERRVNGLPDWSHFYWSAHINFAMNRSQVTVGFLDGFLWFRDFALARRWWSEPACEVEVGGIAGAEVRLHLAAVAVARAPPAHAYSLAAPSGAAAVAAPLSDSPLSAQCPSRLTSGTRIFCPLYSRACSADGERRRVAREARRSARELSRGISEGMRCYSP